MRWNVTVALYVDPFLLANEIYKNRSTKEKITILWKNGESLIELHLGVSCSLRRINMYVFLIRLFLDHRLNIYLITLK